MKLGEYLTERGWVEVASGNKNCPLWSKDGEVTREGKPAVNVKGYDAVLIEWRRIWQQMKAAQVAEGKQ